MRNCSFTTWCSLFLINHLDVCISPWWCGVYYVLYCPTKLNNEMRNCSFVAVLLHTLCDLSFLLSGGPYQPSQH